MKILHTGDNHFQFKRIEEALNCFEYIVQYINQNPVDLVVIAGDIFDRNVMINSTVFKAATALIKEISKKNRLLIVRGNHDPDGSLEVFEKFGNVVLATKPEVIKFNGYNFCCLPYIKIQDLVKSADTVRDMYQAGRDAVVEILDGYSTMVSDPKIFVGHIFIADAVLANSETISPNEVTLPLEDLLRAECDAYMLGHIHNHHQDIFNNHPVRYCGAHYKTTYSEKQQPGFYIWDTDDLDNPKFIETPARDMKEFTVSEDESDTYIKTGRLPFDIPENTDVKINIRVRDSVKKLVSKDKIIALAPDSSSVSVTKMTVLETNARCEKMGTVKTLPEKVKAWCEVRGVEASPSLIEKSEVLEKAGKEAYASY